ncbi:MAG: DUF4159 domain-containing protein [Planctomycetaceae bacterium]
MAPRADVVALDHPRLAEFPLIAMHGRLPFTLSEAEQNTLRAYLNHGGVLFADACCGSEDFDRSFRDALQQVFPKRPLQRIPLTHELFSEEAGHDLRKCDFERPGNQCRTIAGVRGRGDRTLSGGDRVGRPLRRHLQSARSQLRPSAESGGVRPDTYPKTPCGSP